MRRFLSVLFCSLCLFSFDIMPSADNTAYTLTPDTLPELGCDSLEYMPEQKIYHFTKAGSATVDIPVYSGVFAYVTAGGYHSESNGVTDNGENCVCTIKMTFFDENGDAVLVPNADVLIMIPADGAFHRWSIGEDTMYAGLPENVKRVNLTVGGMNDTAYIKSIYISTSDMIARDMSAQKWEVHDVGNIDAQTGTLQRIIMIAFICAVAAIMMIFAKVRSRYRKK